MEGRSIDTRNNLLAGPNTPAEFTASRSVLAPPASESGRLKEFADAGYPLAPSEVSSAGNLPAPSGGSTSDLSAAILTPSAGANLTGAAQIVGRASSADFKSYRVEYGQGISPRTYRRIFDSTRPVENGTLSLWDVSGLEPGIYTIRLTVTDEKRGDITSTVTVTVGTFSSSSQSPGGAAQAPPSPHPPQPQLPPSPRSSTATSSATASPRHS